MRAVLRRQRSALKSAGGRGHRFLTLAFDVFYFHFRFQEPRPVSRDYQMLPTAKSL
jgi:hypothetical protein